MLLLLVVVVASREERRTFGLTIIIVSFSSCTLSLSLSLSRFLFVIFVSLLLLLLLSKRGEIVGQTEARNLAAKFFHTHDARKNRNYASIKYFICSIKLLFLR